MKNVVFWNVTPCGSSENRRNTYLLSVLQLLVTANAVPISLIRFILMMEATRSSETSVLKSTTRRYIPEGAFFRSNEVSASLVKMFSFNFSGFSSCTVKARI
jgi:hypothetical protein